MDGGGLAAEGTAAELKRRVPGEDPDEMTDELADRLDSVFLDSVPTVRRLMDLLEERGWLGWTKLERISPQ